MTTQPGKQIIAVHILSNISKSKGDETKKCGQLIEYNMKNIFLQKPCTKFGGELSPDHSSKKLKLSISLDQ